MLPKIPVETQANSLKSELASPRNTWKPINEANIAKLHDSLKDLRQGFENAPVDTYVEVEHKCFPFQRWVPRYKDNGCELKYLKRALAEDLTEWYTFEYTHPKGFGKGASTKAYVKKQLISEEQLNSNIARIELGTRIQEAPDLPDNVRVEIPNDKEEAAHRAKEAIEKADKKRKAAYKKAWRKQKAVAQQKAKVRLSKKVELMDKISSNTTRRLELRAERDAIQVQITAIRAKNASLNGKLETILSAEKA